MSIREKPQPKDILYTNWSACSRNGRGIVMATSKWLFISKWWSLYQKVRWIETKEKEHVVSQHITHWFTVPLYTVMVWHEDLCPFNVTTPNNCHLSNPTIIYNLNCKIYFSLSSIGYLFWLWANFTSFSVLLPRSWHWRLFLSFAMMQTVEKKMMQI